MSGPPPGCRCGPGSWLSSARPTHQQPAPPWACWSIVTDWYGAPCLCLAKSGGGRSATSRRGRRHDGCAVNVSAPIMAPAGGARAGAKAMQSRRRRSRGHLGPWRDRLSPRAGGGGRMAFSAPAPAAWGRRSSASRVLHGDRVVARAQTMAQVAGAPSTSAMSSSTPRPGPLRHLTLPPSIFSGSFVRRWPSRQIQWVSIAVTWPGGGADVGEHRQRDVEVVVAVRAPGETPVAAGLGPRCPKGSRSVVGERMSTLWSEGG